MPGWVRAWCGVSVPVPRIGLGAARAAREEPAECTTSPMSRVGYPGAYSQPAMRTRDGIMAQAIDRILGWLPGSPDERRPWSPMLPDPDEPEITAAERALRPRIMTSLQEKQGRGTRR